jgi:hypothetical protein
MGVEVIDGPMDLDLPEFAGLEIGGVIRDGAIIDFFPAHEEDPVNNDELPTQTRQAIDKARADLDDALERYVQAKIADSEDIERWQWRAKGKAR